MVLSHPGDEIYNLNNLNSWRSLTLSGMLLYPIHASLVHCQVLGGTPVACLKGQSHECLFVAALTALRSTTRLGSPNFLPTTCIRLHQVVVVFEGTRSRTPKAMSHSNSSFTWSTQRVGIVNGLCTATGSTLSIMIILSGGCPDIKGRGWCGQMLKADAA